MHGEPYYPLPMTADRMTGGSLADSAGQPDSKPSAANSPAAPGAAKAALVRLIDGQIATRRAEIDELTRVRRIVIGEGHMSRG